MDQPCTFAEWVGEFIDRSGIPQAEIERRMAVGKGLLTRWRGQDVGSPRRENLDAFADVLRLSAEERATLLATTGYQVILSSSLDSPESIDARKRYLEALRQRYESYFGAPMSFGSDEYKLVFERELLDCPCEQANPDLAENIDIWMRDYLKSFEPDTLSSKVRALLVEKLPNGEFQQGEVASALAMSSRSLQRGLQKEGTSFKELLEKTREDLALKYIAEKELSLVEVCLLLGFADQSNFTKAFKRWTGKTPNAFRRELVA